MRLMTQTLRGLFLSAACGFTLAAVGLGCGGSADPTPMDMGPGMTPDMMPMEQPPPDCSASMVKGMNYQYGTNTLKLPTNSGSTSYVYDFVGDGKAVNQLKTLVSIVAQSIDVQASVDDAVNAGSVVILANLQTPDAMNVDCSGLTLGLAETPAGPPNYDGTDMFTLSNVKDVKLYGTIKAGKVSTLPSKFQKADNEQRISIMLPIGGAMLPLNLRGVHIEGVLGVGKDGKTKDQPVITSGILHGVVSQKDVDNDIIPNIATLITQTINTGDPADTTIDILISLFENLNNKVSKDKCDANANDCCHTNRTTCKILKEEVKNSAVGKVLVSDVQVFDGNDKWAPVKNGTNKNGLSVGIGFTAVKASF